MLQEEETVSIQSRVESSFRKENNQVVQVVYIPICVLAVSHYYSVVVFKFQASLLKNYETKALTPASLQKELNNLLKFNPDFAEAVSFSIC